MNLLKNQNVRTANEYYKEGLRLLNSNNSTGAQFRLANAYYLSSENPGYGYTFAKALLKNGKRSFDTTKRRFERGRFFTIVYDNIFVSFVKKRPPSLNQ